MTGKSVSDMTLAYINDLGRCVVPYYIHAIGMDIGKVNRFKRTKLVILAFYPVYEHTNLQSLQSFLQVLYVLAVDY